MTMTTNAWLPTWFRALATVVFVLVAAAHVRHARHGDREARVWHAGHVVMALGMIDMTLPLDRLPVPAMVGEAIFASCTVCALGIGLAQLGRHRRCLPWVLSAVGHAGMLGMFAMPRAGFDLLIWVLAGWFALEAVGWLTGVLPSLDAPAPVPLRVAGLRRDPTLRPARASGAVGVAERTVAAPTAVAVRNRRQPALRITLALMALGMAYMLVAMQLGMSAMHEMMHHGAGMAGM
jgi:hypothetical protein